MFLRELNHTAVQSGNLEESVRFYTEILGGRIIRDACAVNGNGRYIYVQIANGVIELVRGMPKQNRRGFQHIAFLLSEGAELKAVRQKLGETGIVFTVEPKKASSGNGFVSFFQDISGASFELIQRQENIRIPDLKNQYIEEFSHISLSVSKKALIRCRDFYINTLGFQLRGVLKSPGGLAVYCKMGEDTIELLDSPKQTAAGNPLRCISFRVKDCFEMKKYLEFHGIACSEPKRSDLGGFQIMCAAGPDGETLEFLDYDSLDNCFG